MKTEEEVIESSINLNLICSIQPSWHSIRGNRSYLKGNKQIYLFRISILNLNLQNPK